MEDKIKDFTNTAVPGVTVRNFVWIMTGIITIVVSGMLGYFNIMSKLDKIDTINGNINIISTKVDNNSSEIKYIQQHTLPSLDNRMSIMEERMKDKIFIKDAP